MQNFTQAYHQVGGALLSQLHFRRFRRFFRKNLCSLLAVSQVCNAHVVDSKVELKTCAWLHSSAGASILSQSTLSFIDKIRRLSFLPLYITSEVISTEKNSFIYVQSKMSPIFLSLTCSICKIRWVQVLTQYFISVLSKDNKSLLYLLPILKNIFIKSFHQLLRLYKLYPNPRHIV